jgi:dihydroflavonol-4-reductase
MSGQLTLVTGATGFIGSWVARQMLEQGERVRVLVRTPSRLADVGIDTTHPQLEVVRGDLLDPATIAPALDGVSRVHHIAGFISTNPRDARRVRDLNVTTTRNLFAACREAGTERIVYLASIFALAGGDGHPATEDSPWLLAGLPVDYVQAKREAEMYARREAANGLPLVFAYPCFCYGPGDVYVSSSELVVSFLRNRLPFAVDGGHNALDVRDAAAGLRAAMERGRIGERYILGGENVTFQHSIQSLARITGRRAPRVRMPGSVVRAAGRIAQRVMREPPLTEQSALMMLRHWYYDDTKARTELGHRSRPLEETLRDAVAWFEARWAGGMA